MAPPKIPSRENVRNAQGATQARGPGNGHPTAASDLPPASVSDGGPILPLRSVSIELPNGDRSIPDGFGRGLANGNCLSCHSAGMVLNQPPLSAAAWLKEVNKTRTAYHAPFDEADMQAIATHLVETQAR
jgi:mono/diheme cytochrome c family protein